MTITLSPLHRTALFKMRPVYSGTETLRPATGGPRMPVDRPGDHWAIEIDAPAFRASCGQAFMADIVRGRSQPLAIQIPEPGIDKGTPGAVVIDGDGQSGEVLAVKGGTPGAILGKGWFISLLTDGHWFAHMIAETVVLDVNGEASVTLWPMLRVPHADNDLVEIVKPMIEGFAVDGGEYDVGRPSIVRPDTVVIEESE